MAQQLTQRKQQELQVQYTNYKNGLQQIAQKIGDVEQEAEEHSKLDRFSESKNMSSHLFPTVP